MCIILIYMMCHYRIQFQGERQGHPIAQRNKTENVEPVEDMLKRAKGWWRDTVLSYAATLSSSPSISDASQHPTQVQQPANVLVVGHGAFISRLLNRLITDGSIDCAEGVQVPVGHCPNASISIVEIHSNGGEGGMSGLKGRLVQYGNKRHLNGVVGVVEGNADELTTPTPQDIASG